MTTGQGYSRSSTHCSATTGRQDGQLSPGLARWSAAVLASEGQSDCLTSTYFADGAAAAEVARQPDGTWLWMIDKGNIAG